MKMIQKNLDMDMIRDISSLSENEISIINEFISNPNYQISDLELNLNFKENDLIDICEKNNLAEEERKVKKRKV